MATTLFESSAICLYLADRFAEKRLAPPVGSPDREPYLQWLLFAEVTLEPVMLEHYRSAQLTEDKKPARARLDEVLAVIDTRLSGRRASPSRPRIWSWPRSSIWRTR